MILMLCLFSALGVGILMILKKKGSSPLITSIIDDMNYNNMGSLGIFADIKNRHKNVLDEMPCRKGEVAVVTGGSRGIGLNVVKNLLKCEMHVVMGVRDVNAVKKTVELLKEEIPQGNVSLYPLDVASLKSIREFVKAIKDDFPEVHVLVNNAGILRGEFQLTEDGFEMQLATNYMGHFFLTHLLLDKMKRAGEKSGKCARIVNVSSCMHYGAEINFDDINQKKVYSSTGGYAKSKLAQLMFSRYLNRYLEAEKLPVKCYAAHPGLVATDMFYNSSGAKSMPWLSKLLKTPEKGAIPIAYCCLSSKLENKGGSYISNGEEGYSTSYSKNEEHQKRLFEMSCEMLKIQKFGEVSN